MSNTYSGRARDAIVEVNAGVIAALTVVDTGELPPTGGTPAPIGITVDASASALGLIDLNSSSELTTAQTSGVGGAANSSVTITDAGITVSTIIPGVDPISLTASVISSESEALCGGVVSGSATIADLSLSLFGISIDLGIIPDPIPPNFTILGISESLASATLILNEQDTSVPNSITVTALHLNVTLTLGLVTVTVDIRLAESHSDITCVPIICVFGGADVETSNGLKKIEDVRRGDLLIDEDGNLAEVVNNAKCPGGMKGYTLMKKGCFGNNLPTDDISITDGHPIHPPGSSEEISPHLLANKTTIIHKRGDVPPTYSIITENRTFVKINGISVST